MTIDVYAVFETGGKQYRVAPGEVVTVDRIMAKPGETVEISVVHLLAVGPELHVGQPAVPEARIRARVIEEDRGEKVFVFKKKRRKLYHQTSGYQEFFSLLRISEIVLGDTAYGVGGARSDASKLKKAIPAVFFASGQEPAVSTETKPRVPVKSAVPPSREKSSVRRERVEARVPSAAPRQAEPVQARPASVQPAAAEAHASRRYSLAALVVALLIAAGVLLWSGTRSPPDAVVAPVSASAVTGESKTNKTAVAAVPSVSKPAARDVALEKPAAAAAPSAPVQPPD